MYICNLSNFGSEVRPTIPATSLRVIVAKVWSDSKVSLESTTQLRFLKLIKGATERASSASE